MKGYVIMGEGMYLFLSVCAIAGFMICIDRTKELINRVTNEKEQ